MKAKEKQMQTTSTILMVYPASFAFNEETSASNAFQKRVPADDLLLRVQAEFNAAIDQLRKHGVAVVVFKDDAEPPKPDAIFPNNWISMHADGRVLLYPMLTPNRRLERNPVLLEKLKASFEIKDVVDISPFENEGLVLEGTGSLIFNHDARKVYACLSPRTSAELLNQVAEILSYEAFAFHATDEQGVAFYHTNVMMHIGTGYAVVCLESIKERAEKDALKKSLERDGLEIVSISLAQVNQFAGNMLQLRSQNGEDLLMMSQTAFKSLDLAQISTLEKYCKIVAVDVPTIECVGGGSIRCMMAEIFLPSK